jgi:WD40 repeat protein
MKDDRITTRPAAHSVPEPDEDAPPRPPRMQVWTRKTLFRAACLALFFAVIGYGVVGAALGRLLPGTSPLRLLLCLLPGPILGLLVGILLSVRRARWRVGKGTRVADRPLPSGLHSSPPLSGPVDQSITDRRGTVAQVRLPVRHVSQVVGRHGPITAVALSGDGRFALSAAKDSIVRLWDLSTGLQVRALESLSSCTNSVAFSGDARLIAAGGAYRKGGGRRRAAAPRFGGVHVWDAESGELLRTITFIGECHALAFLPGGRELVAGGDDYLRVWELEGPSPTALLQVAEGLMKDDHVLAVTVSADGKYALIGCEHTPDPRLIHLGQAQEVRRYLGHKKRPWWVGELIPAAAVAGVAISPDGQRALSGSRDQTARVWDLRTGEQLACFEGHRRSPGWWRRLVGVAWLGNEQAISASENGVVCVWDAATGQEIARHLHGAAVACLVAAHDGRLVVTGGRDGIVRVWDF